MAIRSFLLTVLALAGCSASAQTKKFTIKGNLSDWKGTDTVVMWRGDAGERVADTVTVLKGRFAFNGTAELPQSGVIARISRTGKGARDTRTFYFDEGVTEIKGTDSLGSSKLAGSAVTVDYETLITALNPLMQHFAALRMTAMKTPKAEQQKPEFKALEEAYSKVIGDMVKVKTNFIKGHPNSMVSLMTLSDALGAQVDYQKYWPVYQALSPAMKQHPVGKELAKKLELAKSTITGAKLPDFSSLDTLRKPLTLSSVVAKGKVTLVDFWASWCVPCRKENPNVVKAFRAFHDKGFNILSVSLDKSEAAWKKAITIDGMPWYHVSGLQYWDEPVARLYGINGVPDSFLLDAEGRVVARGLRGEALYKKIESML